MTPEQILAVIGTIIGAPFLLELVKKWFENKNLKLESTSKHETMRDDREWEEMKGALERERKVYADLLVFERKQFSERLGNIEARLGTIQEESYRYQKSYWEERVQRELLQARVDHLERELETLRSK